MTRLSVISTRTARCRSCANGLHTMGPTCCLTTDDVNLLRPHGRLLGHAELPHQFSRRDVPRLPPRSCAVTFMGSRGFLPSAADVEPLALPGHGCFETTGFVESCSREAASFATKDRHNAQQISTQTFNASPMVVDNAACCLPGSPHLGFCWRRVRGLCFAVPPAAISWRSRTLLAPLSPCHLPLRAMSCYRNFEPTFSSLRSKRI